MKKFLTRNWGLGNDFIRLAFRLIFALVMFFGHGLGKWETVISGNISFFDPIGIGANTSFYLAWFAEGICTLFIALGLFTRLAAIPLIINMSVIVFVVHFSEGLSGFEMQLLYLTGFAAIFLLGPGKYSVDNLIAKGK